MNSFILEELMDELAISLGVVTSTSQEDVKECIQKGNCQDMFPMVSNEFTNDSGFTVSIDESKFLNDKDYHYTWIIGSDNEDNMKFLLCIREYEREKTLSIEAFEVNKDMRGYGIGGNVVSVIESVAQNFFKFISVSPFDTEALNFWEHMEYEESKNGHWVKKL